MRLPKIPSNLVTSEQRPLFEKLNTGIRENLQDFTMLEAAGKGTKMAAHFSPSFRSRLSLFSDLLRTGPRRQGFASPRPTTAPP